eukprot:8611060-Pyramimonas_sp.AAC.1
MPPAIGKAGELPPVRGASSSSLCLHHEVLGPEGAQAQDVSEVRDLVSRMAARFTSATNRISTNACTVGKHPSIRTY